MRFLITMTDLEGAWDALPAAEQERIFKLHDEFEAALRAAGRYVGRMHLHPRSEARCVRQDRDGVQQVIEGPYSDAPEYAGGFIVIEADSMDEAIEWAGRCRFMVGTNEVRQIHEG